MSLDDLQCLTAVSALDAEEIKKLFLLYKDTQNVSIIAQVIPLLCDKIVELDEQVWFLGFKEGIN